MSSLKDRFKTRSKSKGAYSPILYDYLKKYQEDPTSRVFAPLAEAYRKAGLVDEAIEIAREGLLVHPHFIGGRVALARALFDKQLYSEVLQELHPVIHDAPDNLVAQRLMGESCLMLGRVAEALGAYKMLLFHAPQDREAAQIVSELESQAYRKGALVLRNDPVASPSGVAAQESGAETADEADFAQLYRITPARAVFPSSPEQVEMTSLQKRTDWTQKVQKLQGMLQKVERYRARVAIRT